MKYMFEGHGKVYSENEINDIAHKIANQFIEDANKKGTPDVALCYDYDFGSPYEHLDIEYEIDDEYDDGRLCTCVMATDYKFNETSAICSCYGTDCVQNIVEAIESVLREISLI